MRDLALAALVFGSIPFILKKPFWGLLVWVWLSIMNPHRLAYGFAYSMPFAQIIAIVLLSSLLVHAKKLYAFQANGITLCLIGFVLWVCVSPWFSFHPSGEFDLWLRVIKIQLMVLITFFLVGNKDELQKLVWILALSVGFFGIKGGLFTIASGGSYRVWGPEGTFIGDNNTLALAVIMVVPLFRYLQMHSENRWVRRACVAAMFLCTVSAVGSYSRGALLALLAMVSFIWLKSRTKAITGILIVAALPVVFNLMPESWMGRMNTIGTYDTDGSALGRINAWWTAWNIALNRFPIGAGFDMYTPEVFGRYAPNPLAIHAAHSIYFQVLGDHGFVGLGLFLAVFGFAWVAGRWVVNNTRGQPSLDWAHDMAAMLQVSLIGYAVGGAFLSLSYYDFPYYVAAMLAILRILVKNELASAATLPIVLKSKVDIARVAKVGAK